MEESQPTQAPKREPAIRTMKSDISEFLKTTKPSLVSILTKQATWQDASALPKKRRLPVKLIIAAIGIGAIITGGLISYSQLLRPAQTQAPEPPATTDPYIFYDSSSDITISRSRDDLLHVFQEAEKTVQPIGSFRRLVITIKNSDGSPTPLALADFMNLFDIQPPAGFLESVTGNPQLFIYEQNSGPHLGVAFEVRNVPRALQSLLSWEPALQHDLEPLFLGKPPPASLRPYTDASYRNISFRYLAIDPDNGVGLGYLFFPARKLILITTSEETFHLFVNRLFENR